MEGAKKLNRLAVDAKLGSKESFNKLAQYYMKYISKFTDSDWYRMSNEAAFECRCVQRLEKMLKTFDPDKDDFDRLAKFRIKQAFLLFLKLGKKKRPTLPLSIEHMQEKSEEDGSTPFDIEDERSKYDIDSGIKKEEIASMLAHGDLRKEIIVDCWSSGIYSDTEISRLLAKRMGGKEESHWKFVQRYRVTCRKLLESY